MQKRISLVLLSLLAAFLGFAQSPIDPITQPYFNLVRPEYTGDQAYETVAFVEKYWRVAGNTGFNETVFLIAKKLEEKGYVLEENADQSTRLTYRIETRTMSQPTWEPVSARLELIGEEKPLLDSETNRNMTYMYSSSTPREGVTGEVVYIASREDFEGKDLAGKILFSDQLSYRTMAAADEALGILTYDMPGYLQPEKNQTSIQFRSLRYQENETKWALALSFEAKERLKEALTRGKVELNVKVETNIYPSEELTIIANVRGSEKAEESLVFSAHIQEPGANDNASGVGAQLEMATLTADLVRSDKLDLKRTLTFLWGDEISSTRRYVEASKKSKTEIKWGISLDMVGENTDVTGGTFLIEKMPDPSAIWTRGDDQHSEWGGRPLQVEDMTPHYLNDFIISIFEDQGSHANWIVKTNPFEGGSDHTPFLRGDIPGLLLWHFTDQFYHTDKDRLDKVSQQTLKNVATGALVSAFTLLNAGEETAEQLTQLILTAAKHRLQTEYTLSKKAIEEGKAKTEEKLILQTWTDWYLASLETISDIAAVPEIEAAKTALSSYAADLLVRL